jgi:hypothetical protein
LRPDVGEVTSTVSDRRDNRDPLSDEMNRATIDALVEIRKDTGRPTYE